jgi:putative dehydrogenase
VATPAAAVTDAEVVITMLADGPAPENVLSGPDGVASTVRPGTIVCDIGTRHVGDRRTPQGAAK